MASRTARYLALSGGMRSYVPLGALKVLTEVLSHSSSWSGGRVRSQAGRHLPQIRVGGALLADGRLGAVAGQHHGRVVEGQAHAAQRVEHLVHVAARQVGASDG